MPIILISFLSLCYCLSLSLSLYFCLSLKSLFPLIIQWSQCRFTETLCVLQVGASSRRRAMALRWRNRPTAAQRSRTMTWKVGPPRNPLSLLKKKKKKIFSSSLPLFFVCFVPGSQHPLPEIIGRRSSF